MTDTLGQTHLGTRLMMALHRVFGFVAKAGFGLFLVVAAVAALVATTFIGLMLAIAAIFLTLTRPRRHKRAPAPDKAQPLEARRTADGWVIEL
jgi:hypothetical protein